MPIMVLCYNCKNAEQQEDTAPEVVCKVEEIQTTQPRTRCDHYDPKDGTSKVACDCSSCSFQRALLILDESEEAGYIQGVKCGAKKKASIRHPGKTCPDFFPAQKTTAGGNA